MHVGTDAEEVGVVYCVCVCERDTVRGMSRFAWSRHVAGVAATARTRLLLGSSTERASLGRGDAGQLVWYTTQTSVRKEGSSLHGGRGTGLAVVVVAQEGCANSAVPF